MALTAQSALRVPELEPTIPALVSLRSTHFTLPYLPSSVREARVRVSDALTAWGFKSVQGAVLVTSELVTNAIQTGCLLEMEFGVQMLQPNRIRIHVRDGSRSVPVRMITGNRDSLATSGRGLQVVDDLSVKWGCDLEARGKVVRADLILR